MYTIQVYLNDCEFFIIVNHNGVEGADAVLMKTLADKFNFKIEYIVSKAGFMGAVTMVYPAFAQDSGPLLLPWSTAI